MTRTLPLRSALVVLLVSLVVAPVASARMDNAARLQMVWPASGTVTSPFGVWRGNHRHEGIDIGMLVSLRVRAVTEGVVESTGYENGYEGYGKIIVLDLPGPYTALYAHLSNVAVRDGEHVREGEWIGQAGCTGNCSGTHLHFEVRHRGVPIDPMSFLG
jgi:murein DD-endopeptidase MepM/ murein hydrolase activator NlpD